MTEGESSRSEGPHRNEAPARSGSSASNEEFVREFESLDHERLVLWVMDAFRRVVVHYGMWFREVEHQLGMNAALQVEAEAGDRAFDIMMKRFSSVLGFELEDGVPAALTKMSRKELMSLGTAISVNWLAGDGVWFQAVEKRFGMSHAQRCNDTCWTRFSPYEAARIKRLADLAPRAGIEGLKRALGLRLYTLVNKQTIEEIDENTIVFRMIDCRVQSARKKRGLPDYPCKGAGLVEYPFFALAIDPRIETECLCCPPDPHPQDFWCAWKFQLKER